MNKSRHLILLVGVVVLGYAISLSKGGPLPPPETKDEVAQACDEYEMLFRQASGEVASRLERGDISTDRQSRDLRAEMLKQSLKAAFTPLAEKEKGLLSPWTAEKEAAMLRGYENAR